MNRTIFVICTLLAIGICLFNDKELAAITIIAYPIICLRLYLRRLNKNTYLAWLGIIPALGFIYGFYLCFKKPISTSESSIKNNKSSLLKRIFRKRRDPIVVNSKLELRKIIVQVIKEDGVDCDLNFIDTSKISDMSGLFKPIGDDITKSVFFHFNGDISKWDVSNVTNMSKMFEFAPYFNGDISKWDVSNVTNMSQMFFYAKNFNGDISKWDVSNVTDMSEMFRCADDFNGDISKWDVSNVTDMSGMFSEAKNFNGDISKWDVSNVTNMSGMFACSNFNCDISKWDVSNVIDMSSMFRYAVSFKKDLSTWRTKPKVDTSYMFEDADTYLKNNKIPDCLNHWNYDGNYHRTSAIGDREVLHLAGSIIWRCKCCDAYMIQSESEDRPKPYAGSKPCEMRTDGSLPKQHKWQKDGEIEHDTWDTFYTTDWKSYFENEKSRHKREVALNRLIKQIWEH